MSYWDDDDVQKGVCEREDRVPHVPSVHSNEVAYVEQPEGYQKTGEEDKVYRL